MALSQPVQDPFIAAAELLAARPVRAARPLFEGPETVPALPLNREMAQRFLTLRPREFEAMLSELESGMGKSRKLGTQIRRGL
jgi:hypothetical protein